MVEGLRIGCACVVYIVFMMGNLIIYATVRHSDLAREGKHMTGEEWAFALIVDLIISAIIAALCYRFFPMSDDPPSTPE